MRIGQGFDAHAFADGVPLKLGGVEIPFDRGLAAHSDGDVLLHALCDALLGATALGDLGRHFPDSDPGLRNVDSRDLVRRCVALIAEQGYRVINADTTVIAQVPKLQPYVAQMRAHMAADLQCETGAVSVKATTTERLGFTGREQGIAALAVVLIDER